MQDIENKDKPLYSISSIDSAQYLLTISHPINNGLDVGHTK